MFASWKVLLKSSQTILMPESYLVGAKRLRKHVPNSSYSTSHSPFKFVSETYGSILFSSVKITLEPEAAIYGLLFLIKWNSFFSIFSFFLVIVMKKNAVFQVITFKNVLFFSVAFFSPLYWRVEPITNKSQL